MKFSFLLLLFLTSCASRMQTTVASNASALEEIRLSMRELHQTLGAQQMDLQLLEEKLAKQKMQTPSSQVATQITLENKIKQLEKLQAKTQSDLLELRTHANQTTDCLQQYLKSIQTLEKQLTQQAERLNEVGKLKTTLHSISKAIHPKNASKKTYTVCPGDSLSEIARKYNTSVEELKQKNHLSNATIIIGQELEVE